MATLNIGMKVNRAITGVTTVNANAYAMVTYMAGAFTSLPSGASNQSYDAPALITRHFGPGQSIPASFTQTFTAFINSGGASVAGTITYSLQSGVELINTI